MHSSTGSERDACGPASQAPLSRDACGACDNSGDLQPAEYGLGKHGGLGETVVRLFVDPRPINREEEAGIAFDDVEEALVVVGLVADTGDRWGRSLRTVVSRGVFDACPVADGHIDPCRKISIRPDTIGEAQRLRASAERLSDGGVDFGLSE